MLGDEVLCCFFYLPHHHLWNQILSLLSISSGIVHCIFRSVKEFNSLLFPVCFVHVVFLASTLPPPGISMSTLAMSLRGLSWFLYHSVSPLFLHSIFWVNFYLLLGLYDAYFFFALFLSLENKQQGWV